MQTYLAGADVTLTFSLTGDELSASFRLVDEDGTELFNGAAPGFVPGATELALVIAGALNHPTTTPATSSIPEKTNVRGYRAVSVSVQSAAGTRFLSDQEYVVEVPPAALLTPSVNSFQTIMKAEMNAVDLPNLDAWMGATREQRIPAMIQARLNLDQLRYRYREMADDWMNYILPQFGVSTLTQLTQAQYIALPADFRFALERAQILEANDLLGNDPATATRQAGVIMEKIGESTTQFVSTRANRGLVCDAAMKALARFVVKRVRLTRS